MQTAKQSSGDQRYRLLESAMKRHHYRADALIEVLHTAQELFGYVEKDLLLHVARSLRLPPSRVYGVATFYHLFALTPKGLHQCLVCMGTACYVKGAAELAAAVQDETGLRPGETSADGRISFQTSRCFGACGIAPTVVLDGAVQGFQTPEAVRAFVKGCLDGRG